MLKKKNTAIKYDKLEGNMNAIYNTYNVTMHFSGLQTCIPAGKPIQLQKIPRGMGRERNGREGLVHRIHEEAPTFVNTVSTGR